MSSKFCMVIQSISYPFKETGSRTVPPFWTVWFLTREDDHTSFQDFLYSPFGISDVFTQKTCFIAPKVKDFSLVFGHFSRVLTPKCENTVAMKSFLISSLNQSFFPPFNGSDHVKILENSGIFTEWERTRVPFFPRISILKVPSLAMIELGYSRTDRPICIDFLWLDRLVSKIVNHHKQLFRRITWYWRCS